MKLYILSVSDNRIKRITRLLEKHGMRYSAILIVLVPDNKTRAIGGIISKYDLQRVRLEDVLFYLAPP